MVGTTSLPFPIRLHGPSVSSQTSNFIASLSLCRSPFNGEDCLLPSHSPLTSLPILCQSHQNSGRSSNGEPFIRPHARLDETTQSPNQWRRRYGVKPSLHDGPQISTYLLQKQLSVRQSGSRPLLPSHSRTNIRLREHLRRVTANERLRPAGIFDCGVD